MQDYSRLKTTEDIVRRYDLGRLKVDRQKISTLDEELTKTGGILDDFVTQVTEDIENIQDQLDGNITSWFYNYDPTLNNEPAVNWTTDAMKDEHLGDLFYNTDEGTAYRFIYENNAYVWKLLTDDAAAQALAIANAAKDTADAKRRVFVVQPTVPYDVGDVWWRSNGELYRCVVAEPETGEFKAVDWTNDLKYTDDSTAIQLTNTLRTDIQRDYVTQTAFTTADNYVKGYCKTLEVTSDMDHRIFREQPTVPYYQDEIYILGQNVYRCIQDRTEGVYTASDWEVDTELTSYVRESGFEMYDNSINMVVREKANNDGEELITAINLAPSSAKINSQNIEIAGRTIDLTGDEVAITSDNFEVTKEGDVTARNITATGTIYANAGNIGGCQIQNNSLKVDSAHITSVNADTINAGTLNGNQVAVINLDASKIITGTMSANHISGGNIDGNNVNITNLKAGNIVSGTLNGNNVNITNLNASNIKGGSLTAGQINYQKYSDGWKFFRAGYDYANSPYVSALNVAYGAGGISFRTSNEPGSVGSQYAYIKMNSANDALRIDGNSGVNINDVKFYDNYVHAGNLSFGGQYVTADKGDLNLNTAKSGKYVYANGTRIGGSPSERKTKKNIKELNDKKLKELIEEVKRVPVYSYDYKKSYCGEKDNLGIIIDDLDENATFTKALHIIEYEGVKKYNHDDLSQIDFVLIKELINKIDKLEKEVEELKERSGAND